MNRRLYAYAAAALCLVALATSFQFAAAGDTKAVEATLRSLGYSTIPLRKTATNEYEMDATLNGNKKITLLLSFHASSTIFDTDKIAALGVEATETNQTFEVNGDEDNVFVVRTDSINIGDGRIGPEELMSIKFREFEAFEDYRVTGILGRDFLVKHDALLDLGNQKLYLKIE
jgi:hypothetical protein